MRELSSKGLLLREHFKRRWTVIEKDEYYEIPLSRGYVAKIDKDDLPKIANFSWFASPSGKNRDMWEATCQHRGKRHRKNFKLEQEAINYRKAFIEGVMVKYGNTI